MADEVALVVNGRRYAGLKSVRVTLSMESIAGSFALEVSDRWGALEQPWPIAEEDPCRVEVGGEVVIDGYIDRRSPSASASARQLQYSGRDRAAALVDCSVMLERWTFYNVGLADFVRALAAPFGVRVAVQAGLVLPSLPKVVVSPGDKAYEAMQGHVADAGALLVSDGAGGIVITRSSKARAASLVEGENILTAAADYDGTERFHRYVILGQSAGTDEAAGDVTRIRAEATDAGVRRTDRVLVLRPDRIYSQADAQRRADWEARVRAARAEPVSIGVVGWRQPGGSLWRINTLAHVEAPRSIGVDGDLLISQVEYSVGDGGQVTQLRLVRPDAFTPEPKAVVKPSDGPGAWKELVRGAL